MYASRPASALTPTTPYDRYWLFPAADGTLLVAGIHDGTQQWSVVRCTLVDMTLGVASFVSGSGDLVGEMRADETGVSLTARQSDGSVTPVGPLFSEFKSASDWSSIP